MKRFFQDKVPNVNEFFKYIGPGFIVTVGFIDPGNWATNLQAGSEFGYTLLWVVTISTLMLILLQNNASKLGIISQKCIAEAANDHFSKFFSKILIYSGLVAIVATIVAELLGGAIALNMIFNIPIKLGAFIMAGAALWFVLSNNYYKIENIIIGFVSIIAFSFLIELFVADVDLSSALISSTIPRVPHGSTVIIMGVLGAVVMPHNLFLHSEFIQSRQWDISSNSSIKKQLKLAKTDTYISMVVGFAINSAMIILAASTFYVAGTIVTDLTQAQQMLVPLLGNTAAGIFALALLFSGLASSITAAMSGGVLSAGLFNEEYNISDRHTTLGIIVTLIAGVIVIAFIKDPFNGLILSQVILSIQLPITIVALIKLTSSKELMGDFSNNRKEKILLWSAAIFVIFLNMVLLFQILSSLIR